MIKPKFPPLGAHGLAQSALDKPLDILIVDDTPANLRLLAQLLTEHGYKVRAVLNGQRAIEAAQAQVPDLILLDVMMPELDGYAVCQRLKSLPATREVPVIFITAYPERFLTGERPEPAFLIAKPFQPATVSAVLSQALFFERNAKRRERRAS